MAKASRKSTPGKAKPASRPPMVGIIMGSISDWETMKEAATVLADFSIPFESKVVSAHRTPELMVEYAKSARGRGVEVIIAGAGGAAHLPGMTASLTSLPVIGVPVASKHLNGMDSLLSIAQMPAGIPVATMAIGNAKNAGLMAARILAVKYPAIASAVDRHRASLDEDVRAMEIPGA
ncbi:MAG TPA: 5-(carboxyamino)imidazole ribonucleotide mutase [Fibrobacteria bacterium]|nr:5-(carboxyamino)imidazole ribonucleotide mutase [Fibrobacteria bacterium]